jgi:hypothetical protein
LKENILQILKFTMKSHLITGPCYGLTHVVKLQIVKLITFIDGSLCTIFNHNGEKICLRVS